MALTVRNVFRTAIRDLYLTVNSVDFDSAYATNGMALTAANLGFSDHTTLLQVMPFPSGGRIFDYDKVNAKLKAYQDNGTATAAALPEVGNGVNLSTVTGVIVLALGKNPA